MAAPGCGFPMLGLYRVTAVQGYVRGQVGDVDAVVH